MIKVYIASPYTLGDVAVNVKVQMEIANELMDKGLNPFVPLYSHFQHMMFPRSYDYWLKRDFEWIESCDCILRLPGESSGADSEVFYAKKINKPIFYSTKALYDYFKIT